MFTSSFRTLAVFVALSGCAAQVDDAAEITSDVESASAPTLGAADGTDRADHDCQIVLRKAFRRDAGPTWETTLAPDGHLWWVWRIHVDVAEGQIAAGNTPHVLHEGSGSWYEVAAEREVEGAPAGFKRFEFAIWKDGMRPDWTARTIEGASIELVPFLREADGSRVFDHNQSGSDFQNYVLDVGNRWDIAEAPSVCGARADVDWMGNPGVEIERYTSRTCANARAYDGSVSYEQWARTRAAVRNLCFEVYERGLTDRENPELWRDLDVQVHYRFGNEVFTGFTTEYVNQAGRVGNNAQYAFDMGHLDPFIGGCPRISVQWDRSSTSDWVDASADLHFYFTVNGKELRPGGAGSTFDVNYKHYVQRSCFE